MPPGDRAGINKVKRELGIRGPKSYAQFYSVFFLK